MCSLMCWSRSTHTLLDPGKPAGVTGLITALSPALQARSSDPRTVLVDREGTSALGSSGIEGSAVGLGSLHHG